MKSFEEIEEILKEKLSEKRVYHSRCVSMRCEELAKIYNENIAEARLVGIAHDIAKEMPHEEKIQVCKENGIEIDGVELKSPGLLHAKVGAFIAKTEFGFNQRMCEAIENHTTGKAKMDMLSKILYIADYTSEDRKYDYREYFYNLANQDIEKAVFESYCKSIQIRLEEGKTIHLSTVEARNEYLKS